MIRIRRAYEAPQKSDGMRILVDRVWPRGRSKAQLKLDHWMKDVAPSTKLRTWFKHDPAKWNEFKKRYKAELKGSSALSELRALAKKHTVTLVYGAKDTEHNQAVALTEMLGK